MGPGVYIVGTPIGNLEDISRRALDVLRSADIILAEDTRHTRILLQRHDIRGALISCHKFNEASRLKLALDRAREGRAVALVSNAGMPGISDPGSRVVAACRRQGIPVTVIPGPSAVTAAVVLSGFGDRGFVFDGFLPVKGAARRRRLEALARLPYAVVVFESPYRAIRLLEDIRDCFGDRELFVGRELTKMHEENLWGSAASLLDLYRRRESANPPRRIKGELVVVISAADRGAAPPAATDAGPPGA